MLAIAGTNGAAKIAFKTQSEDLPSAVQVIGEGWRALRAFYPCDQVGLEFANGSEHDVYQ